MLLGVLTVLIALAAGYAYLREGLFTAFAMSVNVLLAGLVAFNFWEPMAGAIESSLSQTFLAGFEDAFCLVLLFAVTLGLLRTATNYLVPTQIDYPPVLQRPGGFLFGCLAGYLTAGFLACMLQTLPWHEHFMYFDADADAGSHRILPPDRVWLALMSRAGAYPFANDEEPRSQGATSPYDKFRTFDRDATFEIRYARYRRYGDKREALPYHGEFDVEIYKSVR